MGVREASSFVTTVVWLLVGPACSPAAGGGDSGFSAGDTDTGEDDADETGEDEEESSDDGAKFDVNLKEDTEEPEDICKVPEGEGMDAILPCPDQAPPDSFDPVVKWEWTVPAQDAGSGDSVVTPLVANLTDDNDDGSIDLCDTPDVVVVAGDLYGEGIGYLYVLDGATGEVHAQSGHGVMLNIPPALGDIDNDGLPEIVVGQGGLRVYEHDLTEKFLAGAGLVQGNTTALADLDNDGDVEIIIGPSLFDHEGQLLWSQAGQADGYLVPSAVAADLDGDDDMEVVYGRSAFHHDGTPYYDNQNISPGYPQVANFDDDDDPEILIVNRWGLGLLEHDGTPIYLNQNPTGVNTNVQGFGPWLRPAAVHDFDGDGQAEFAVSSLDQYGVFEADASANWISHVFDASGRASGTAFDFLGDGEAEAIYADETQFFAFDEVGGTLLAVERVSPTQIEYPIVADVDNDQAAEVVVVSSAYPPSYPNLTPTTVKVIEDAEDPLDSRPAHLESAHLPRHERARGRDHSPVRAQALAGTQHLPNPGAVDRRPRGLPTGARGLIQNDPAPGISSAPRSPGASRLRR